MCLYLQKCVPLGEFKILCDKLWKQVAKHENLDFILASFLTFKLVATWFELPNYIIPKRELLNQLCGLAPNEYKETQSHSNYLAQLNADADACNVSPLNIDLCIRQASLKTYENNPFWLRKQWKLNGCHN